MRGVHEWRVHRPRPLWDALAGRGRRGRPRPFHTSALIIVLLCHQIRTEPSCSFPPILYVLYQPQSIQWSLSLPEPSPLWSVRSRPSTHFHTGRCSDAKIRNDSPKDCSLPLPWSHPNYHDNPILTYQQEAPLQVPDLHVATQCCTECISVVFKVFREVNGAFAAASTGFVVRALSVTPGGGNSNNTHYSVGSSPCFSWRSSTSRWRVHPLTD